MFQDQSKFKVIGCIASIAGIICLSLPLPAIVQNFHKVHALESHKKFSERVFTQLKLNKIVKERVNVEHKSKNPTVPVKSYIFLINCKTGFKETTRQQNQGVKLMCSIKLITDIYEKNCKHLKTKWFDRRLSTFVPKNQNDILSNKIDQVVSRLGQSYC